MVMSTIFLVDGAKEKYKNLKKIFNEANMNQRNYVLKNSKINDLFNEDDKLTISPNNIIKFVGINEITRNLKIH